MSNDLIAIVTSVLERAPTWVRVDLSAKDPAARARAEETLGAMVAAALKNQGQDRAA